MPGKFDDKMQGNKGLYYTNMKYDISSTTDYEGSLTASYSYQGMPGQGEKDR